MSKSKLTVEDVEEHISGEVYHQDKGSLQSSACDAGGGQHEFDEILVMTDNSEDLERAIEEGKLPHPITGTIDASVIHKEGGDPVMTSNHHTTFSASVTEDGVEDLEIANFEPVREQEEANV